MATRKSTGIIPGSADVPDDEREDVQEFALDRVLAALSDSVPGKKPSSVKLYRKVRVDPTATYAEQQEQHQNRGKYEWLRDYEAEELDGNGLNTIRSQFGPGEYRLKAYGYTETNNFYALLAAHDVLLGTVPGQTYPKANPPAPLPVEAPKQNSELTAILAMLAEGQQRLLAAVTEKPDPMTQMQQMFAMMTGMREAMGININPQKSSITELIEEMRAMKSAGELFGGEKEQTDTDKLLELAKPVLVMVAQSMQPKTVPQIALPETFARAPAPTPAPAPAPAPALNGSPVPTFAPAPNPNPTLPATEPSEQQMIEKMQSDLNHLLKMAEQKNLMGPTDAAGYIYENLPDDFLDLLEHPSWFEALSAFESRVIPHKQFFEAVRAIVLKMQSEDDLQPEQSGDLPPNLLTPGG